MLNSEKNAFLLKGINPSGVEPGIFRLSTVTSRDFAVTRNFQESGLQVQLESYDLWFVTFKWRYGENESQFACKATRYDYVRELFVIDDWIPFPGAKAGTDDKDRRVFVGPLTEATGMLCEWIKSNVPRFMDEKSVPDLWQVAATGGAITSLAGVEDTPFSPEERLGLTRSVEQLQAFILATFEANEQQTKLLAQKLQALTTSLQYLGRSSWFSFALGTLVTIGSTLYLNNEQGRILIEYARQLFEGVVKYLN